MSGTLGVIGGTLSGSTPGGSTPLGRIETSGTVTVTADATAHTKGAWTTLVASTAAEATMLILCMGVGTSTVDTATLIDLAVGGSGSEEAFLSDLPVGSASLTLGGNPWQLPLPVAIPAGSRISARIQSVVAGGKTASVAVELYSGGSITPGALTVLGANAGTSRGTALSTAWTQIVASTAETYRHLIPVPSASNAAAANYSGNLIVGSGAAASEVEIGKIPVITSSSEYVGAPSMTVPWGTYAVMDGAASGTRIALKVDGTLSTALDGAVIGVA